MIEQLLRVLRPADIPGERGITVVPLWEIGTLRERIVSV